MAGRPALALLLGALALAGCKTTQGLGEAERDAELARVRGEPLRVLDKGPERIRLEAGGRALTLVPVEGLCLASEALEVGPRGLFAVAGDRVTETGPEAVGLDPEGGALYRLPPSFPGLLTLSVSATGLFGAEPPDGGRASALDRLSRFLKTEDGRAMLGRDGAGDAVEVLESRVMGNALYVHVEDGADGLRLLAPDFWRAFVEIEGRMVLVTVSGLRDRPLGEGTMMGVLAAQVARLRRVNGGAPVAQETELAAAALALLRQDGPAIAIADPSVLESTATARAPYVTPQPLAREGRMRVELRPFSAAPSSRGDE